MTSPASILTSNFLLGFFFTACLLAQVEDSEGKDLFMGTETTHSGNDCPEPSRPCHD